MKIINLFKQNCLKLTLIFLMNFLCNNYVFAQENSQENLLNFPEINENFSKPSVLGVHNLKVWGLKIYKIELLSQEKNFSYKNKLAIIINYQRDFTKDNLIKRSIEEISRANEIKDEILLKKYQNKLEEIFFNVKKGDRKTAFFDPKIGVKLYFNGKYTGAIEDLIFAKRFMDIWLGERSSFPQMTKDILGKNE
jgi:hypothetical protein